MRKIFFLLIVILGLAACQPQNDSFHEPFTVVGTWTVTATTCSANASIFVIAENLEFTTNGGHYGVYRYDTKNTDPQKPSGSLLFTSESSLNFFMYEQEGKLLLKNTSCEMTLVK